MTFFFRKTHKLVLNRRTVPRPGAANLARIKRRTADIVKNHAMCLSVRVYHMTGRLRKICKIVFRTTPRERKSAALAILNLKNRQIYRRAEHTRRRTGLESHQLDTLRRNRRPERFSRKQSIRPGREIAIPNKHTPLKIGTRRNDSRFAAPGLANRSLHTSNAFRSSILTIFRRFGQ